MATKKSKGLGMGLEALLGPRVDDAVAPGLPTSLPLSRLRAGRYQPRMEMDEGALADLADSIRSHGVMQPILVRPLDGGADGDYEIIAGERRFRAAGLAGLDAVPVLVREVSDETAAVMALIENIQREDLGPLEEAAGLQRLVQEFKLSHEQAARAVGRSRSAATNLMRLLQLAEPVQRMLSAGDLDMGHARALLVLGGAEQVMCAQQIAARGLSVRETEKLVARQAPASSTAAAVRPPSGAAGGRAPSAAGAAVGPARTADPAAARDLARLQERLADHLTAPVQIRLQRDRHGAAGRTGRAPSRGEIAIPFASLDALDSLLDKLGLRAE